MTIIFLTVLKARPGGYSLLAKISALALDEQAPHGFVGYANLLRASHASLESDQGAPQDKKITPLRWGERVLGGYSCLLCKRKIFTLAAYKRA